MTILNIHGFDGKPNNINFDILTDFTKDRNAKVLSYPIDYRNLSLLDIHSKLQKVINDKNVSLIVATSFGAFVGKQLSIDNSIPFICTNPCFRPDITIKSIAPEYFEGKLGKINSAVIDQWIANRREASKKKTGTAESKDIIFLGDEDNVIDSAVTLKEIKNNFSLVYNVHGGHSLPRDAYQDKLIQLIELF